MAEQKKKPKRRANFKPGDPAWEREAALLARCYAPEILPCKDCGHPVVNGYCCTYCGSVNPRADG